MQLTLPTKQESAISFIIPCVLGMLFFLLYISLNYDIVTKTSITNTQDTVFGSDQWRAFGDLTVREADHYRTKVHPLFVIIFQPIVWLLNMFFNDFKVTVMLLQAFISAFTVALLYSYLTQIGTAFIVSLLLTLIYGTSFSQIVFTLTPETFIYAGLSLIGMHYIIFQCLKSGRILLKPILIAGVMSIAITVTNVAQFIFALYYLCKRTIPQGNHLRKFYYVIFLVLFLSILLAGAQKIFYPTSENFAAYIIFPREEFSYMNMGGGSIASILDPLLEGEGFKVGMAAAETALNVEKVITETYVNLFCRGWIFSDFTYSDKIDQMTEKQLVFLALSTYQVGFTAIFNMLLIVSVMGNYLLKDRGAYKYTIYSILSASLIFNVLLHALYGRDEGWLFSQHYLFLVLLIIGLFVSRINEQFAQKRIIVQRALVSILISFFAFQFHNNIFMFNKFKMFAYKFYGI